MKVCHYLPGDMGEQGGGGYPEIVTNGDMGGGRSKNYHFCRDVLSERPLLCLFEENHCSPALLKVLIYSTELVPIIFVYTYPILSWRMC